MLYAVEKTNGRQMKVESDDVVVNQGGALIFSNRMQTFVAAFATGDWASCTPVMPVTPKAE
jgi:hypothetical protein